MWEAIAKDTKRIENFTLLFKIAISEKKVTSLRIYFHAEITPALQIFRFLQVQRQRE
jgi:hypothetical protein